MKNLPMFTTENGVASLTLQEIPYTKRAYIRIHSTLNADGLLAECVDFCRAVGAEAIFATGDEMLCKYPLHTQIVSMIADKCNLERVDARAVPVTQNDIDEFCSTYNEKMSEISNAAYMTQADAALLLSRGGGYFVWKDDTIIGIGITNGCTLEMIASVIPGMGMIVLSALSSVITENKIRLEVATNNSKAVNLYNRAGFVEKEIISTWYKVFELSRKNT